MADALNAEERTPTLSIAIDVLVEISVRFIREEGAFGAVRWGPLVPGALSRRPTRKQIGSSLSVCINDFPYTIDHHNTTAKLPSRPLVTWSGWRSNTGEPATNPPSTPPPKSPSGTSAKNSVPDDHRSMATVETPDDVCRSGPLNERQRSRSPRRHVVGINSTTSGLLASRPASNTASRALMVACERSKVGADDLTMADHAT